jgi:diacylglycerol kinase family enzyme
MKIRFIFNPASGRLRRDYRLRALLKDYVGQPGHDAELCITEGPGHATVLAREAVARGCPRIVAVGGDGTLNEVAQAIVRTPAALGLIPCGSGNGLARYLRLPASPRKALAMLSRETPTVATLDSGLADGHPFFNAMGLGLDAEVSRQFNGLVKRGLPAYLRTAIAAYRQCARARFTIEDGRQRETVPALLVAVANSDQYGNDARIAPGARADDGLLDLVTIPPVGLFGAVGLAARLFLGGLDRAPGVHHWRAASFRIERAGPGLIHTDGETHLAGPVVEVSVLAQSLRVLVPIRPVVSRPEPLPIFQPTRREPSAAASSFALKL